MKLYRAVSEKEIEDFDFYKEFRTGRNTLEAKQFFKSKNSCIDFAKKSVMQEYDPPYKFLLTVDVNEDYLQNSNDFNSILDGYDAISIEEDNLLEFNFYIKFVIRETL